MGIFAHPIFSKDGDYPEVVRERVDYNSKREGRSSSRLPTFTKEEILELKGRVHILFCIKILVITKFACNKFLLRFVLYTQ